MSLYFVALIPPGKIKDEIRSLKEEVREKYQMKHALKLPAHITLQRPFKMPEPIEEELKVFLESFSEKQQAFIIKISGFGRFDQRAIFAEVINKQPVINLFDRLQEGISPFVHAKDKQHSIHPHLTIATRDLGRQNFQRVWEDFKDREYEADFKAESLFLLKHNGKLWEIISENDFNRSSS